MDDIKEFKSLNDVIAFQVSRRIIGNAKEFLNILESNKCYTQKLETLLTAAGIEDFINIEQEHKIQRKKILDASNDSSREIIDMINKFDFKIKT